MSETFSGLAQIQARLNELQGRFMGAPLPTPSSNATDFASLLSNAQSQQNVDPNAIVADATKYLGVPYKWGGTDPSTGLDCSGLVQRVFGDLGISMPRLASDQAKQGQPVQDLAHAQPGDLVAFDVGTKQPGIDHIGIYIGNNQMIVAPHTGANVEIEKITQTPAAIRRIVNTDNVLNLNNSQPGYTPISPANLGAYQALLGLGIADDSNSSSSINSLLSSMPTNPLSSSSSLNSLYGSTSNSSDSNAAGGFAQLFMAAGNKYGVDPNLLAAVAKAESNFNPNANSGAGAQGLMQLMPSTAQSLGVNPYNPAQAIDGAARLLKGHLQRFGSTDLALAAYNAGGGAVAKYGGIPPYAETQNYVRRVNQYAQQNLLNTGVTQ